MYFSDDKGNKFRILFHHFSDFIARYDGDKPGMTTRCEIKLQVDGKDSEDIIFNESAHCSSKDCFVKNKGRKIALKRVLEKHFNKDERSRAWHSYNNRKKI